MDKIAPFLGEISLEDGTEYVLQGWEIPLAFAGKGQEWAVDVVIRPEFLKKALAPFEGRELTPQEHKNRVFIISRVLLVQCDHPDAPYGRRTQWEHLEGNPGLQEQAASEIRERVEAELDPLRRDHEAVLAEAKRLAK